MRYPAGRISIPFKKLRFRRGQAVNEHANSSVLSMLRVTTDTARGCISQLVSAINSAFRQETRDKVARTASFTLETPRKTRRSRPIYAAAYATEPTSPIIREEQHSIRPVFVLRFELEFLELAWVNAASITMLGRIC